MVKDEGAEGVWGTACPPCWEAPSIPGKAECIGLSLICEDNHWHEIIPMSGFWIDVIDPISGAGGFYTENMLMKRLKIKGWGMSLDAHEVPEWIVALALAVLGLWGLAWSLGWM